MKYIIKREISSGTFGTIYEILNEEDNKIYALKELTRIDAVSKQRFEREVKILSELDHPNIVKTFYWNVGGDPPMFAPYYVMEYLLGDSLRHYMDEKFKNNKDYFFDSKWAINTVILPVCSALAQAHGSNIYHRDLKPSNIMFTDSTRSMIKITDWGLVKGEDYFTSNNGDNSHDDNNASAVNIERKNMDSNPLELTAIAGEGNIGGTPDYCSPEQWFVTVNDNDRINDGRADIFSLGVIFYEMLTRKRPSSYDPNEPDMSRKKVESPSKYNPSISPQLDQCILKMVDLKPENRQQSVGELITEFKTL